MSRYPTVLLFRDDKYASQVDPYVLNTENKDKFVCTIRICSTSKPLQEIQAELITLWNPTNMLMITVGDTPEEYHPVIRLPPRLRARWIHYSTDKFIDPAYLPEFNRGITYCFVHNSIEERQLVRPVFSLFTTCYNSFQKIIRAYNSIKAQQMQDWEWVIVDDSPHSQNHFEFLRELFRNDERVRLYNRADNNGSIGNVKNEAIALCRGKYVLEMDHDDEILPDTLSEATAVFDANPDVGFVYMDFANVYENGSNFKYCDFYGFGYCGYYCQKWYNPTKDRVQWVNVSITAQVNNITMMHLISMPNHPRMWRRSVLNEMGSYSEYLPICDDQEILMRTSISTRCAKINRMGYIQYMNDGGNNFSYIRNQEINRIGPHHLCPQFYQKYRVNETMEKMGVSESIHWRKHPTPMWKRDPTTYHPAFINMSFPQQGISQQTCVFGLSALTESIEYIRSILANPSSRDVLVLDGTMNPTTLCTEIDKLFNGMVPTGLRCYAMENTTADELVRYFFWLYKSKGTTPELIWARDNLDIPDSSRIALIRGDDTQVMVDFSKATNTIPVPITTIPVPTTINTIPVPITTNTIPVPITTIPVPITTNTIPVPDFIWASSRAAAINYYLSGLDTVRYVEIGVEYGSTFGDISGGDRYSRNTQFLTEDDQAHRFSGWKVAVDPDPKFTIESAQALTPEIECRMYKLTSDEFFADPANLVEPPNAIFIDGMHQVEYVARDIDNSIRVLSNESKEQPEKQKRWLFIDDVLPQTKEEQYKIPTIHYYENGILKCGEAWTGDVWKVVYYLIRSESFRNAISGYHVHTHPSFRGVIAISLVGYYQFPEGAVDEMNSYDYDRDFSDYISLLNSWSRCDR
jgi:glycosyltransferase involved in cell wall biosynthesis